MTKSELEQSFAWHWRTCAPDGLPEPERDARFHPIRRWRVDFLWRGARVAVEVEGKVWGRLVRCHACGAQVMGRRRDGSPYPIREAGGRHVRGAGFERDAEKYNALASLGYLRFTVTSKMLNEEPAQVVEMIVKAIAERSE